MGGQYILLFVTLVTLMCGHVSAQTYQTCPMVPSYDAFGNPILTASGTPVLVPDPACVSANQNIAYSSGQSQAGGFTLSGSSVVAPPVANCGTPGTPAYTACMDTYNAQVAIYNANVSQNQTASSPLTTEQQSLYTVNNNSSALGVLTQMLAANQMGQQNYSQTSNDASIAGASQLVIAGECASTCTVSGTGGCCSDSSQYYATGAGYLLTQRQAEAQSLQHYNAAYTSCTERNQILSGEPLDCASVMGSPSASTTVIATTTASAITISMMTGTSSSPVIYNPLTGSCTPPESATCKKLVNQLGAVPASVRQAILNKGLKNSSVDAKTLYKKNGDGTIGVGNGKSFSMKDFLSAASLSAKGLTSATALKAYNGFLSFAGGSDTANITMKNIGGVSGTSFTSLAEGVSGTIASGVVKVTDPNYIDCYILPVEYVEGEYIGAVSTQIFHTINCGYIREYELDNFIKSKPAQNKK